MPPLVDIILGGLTHALSGAAVGLVTAVLCAPVLAFHRVRSAFSLRYDMVWPVTYALFIVAVGAVQGAVIGTATNYITETDLMLKVVFGAAAGVPIAAWALLGAAQADETGSEGMGWIYAMVLCGLWHAVQWSAPLYLLYLLNKT